MTFSEMLCDTIDIKPETGDLTGECCICKKHTETGFKKKFGANFTCADYVSTGEVICPECQYLVKNSNEYRRTMFLLTSDELIKFKKKEAKDIVFDLPNEPFYLYLTKTWQKIGWVRMNEVYNTGNDGIINFLVDYDIIRTSLYSLKEHCDNIHMLRELKIPKTVLETGKLEMHHFNRIKEEYDISKARTFSRYLNVVANNPVYDLALYLED